MSEQSWPQRASNSQELVVLVTRAIPAGALVAALGIPVLIAADGMGMIGVGFAAAAALVVAGGVVGVKLNSSGNKALEEKLPRLRVAGHIAHVPTDEGDKTVDLSKATVESGWYDRRPTSRSIGAWVHLNDGTNRVTIACIEDTGSARAAGIERSPGGGPESQGYVDVPPEHLGPIWLALKAGGATHKPWVAEG